MTLEDITEALAEQGGFCLYLTDVASGADLHSLFQRWRGDTHFDESSRSSGQATVLFNTGAQLREALASFGGGLRGQFRVNRAATLGEASPPATALLHLLSGLSFPEVLLCGHLASNPNELRNHCMK